MVLVGGGVSALPPPFQKGDSDNTWTRMEEAGMRLLFASMLTAVARLHIGNLILGRYIHILLSIEMLRGTSASDCALFIFRNILETCQTLQMMWSVSLVLPDFIFCR